MCNNDVCKHIYHTEIKYFKVCLKRVACVWYHFFQSALLNIGTEIRKKFALINLSVQHT